MTEEEIRARIMAGRAFMGQWETEENQDFVSDQNKKLPQPPLVKAAMRREQIPLPTDFGELELINDTLRLFGERKSSRVYTEEPMTFRELSFLLWVSQGVKGLRGRAYATLRTVPSAGARHPYECYLLIRRVEGLTPGAYHYLPMEHALELLCPEEDLKEKFGKDLKSLIPAVMHGQAFTGKASAAFFYAMNAYRAEWRYGIRSHRVALMDAGHIVENLYLACAALKLGVCAVGAMDMKLGNALFELDGTEEFLVYSAACGTISEANAQAEQDFYAFVKKENL